MQLRMVLFLPRDAASVPVTRRMLDGCLETLGVTADTRADIALALSEACANVVQHAGPGEEYEVTATAADGRCIIEVINTGGADGSRAALSAAGAGHATAEHGRGLKIMDTVTDRLRVSGGPSQGTTVHMEKVLQWDPGAAGALLLRKERDAADG